MAGDPVEIRDLPGGEKLSLELTDVMIQERDEGTTGVVDGLTSVLGYDNSLRFGCKVERSTPQSIDGAWVTAAFDTEIFDFGNLFDVNLASGRITIPPGGDGIYSFHAFCDFEANTSGRRQMRFIKNSLTEEIRFRDGNVSATGETTLELYTLAEMVAGDWMVVQIGENVTGSLNCGVLHPITFSAFMWRYD